MKQELLNKLKVVGGNVAILVKEYEAIRFKYGNMKSDNEAMRQRLMYRQQDNNVLWKDIREYVKKIEGLEKTISEHTFYKISVASDLKLHLTKRTVLRLRGQWS